VKKNLIRIQLAWIILVIGLGLALPVRHVSAQQVESPSTETAPDAQKDVEGQDSNDQYRKSKVVTTLGAKLGMNAEQSATAFEFVNFALLASAIGWVVVKVLPKAIRDRNSSIQKHLVDARTATEEARVRLNSVEARLAKLDDEIAAMQKHAEHEIAKEEQRIKTSVEDERKKILAAAEQEISVATLHAQKQLQQFAADLAIEQAARKLVITAETDRLLVQNFAQRLTGDDSKKGQN
jgi:F-type H+-transporting ATPase subunit b